MNNKSLKFTFKTEKATGRYMSFSDDTIYIKFKKTKVGTIGAVRPHRIRLQVTKQDILEDGNANCLWKWITLSKEFDCIQAAKDFLNANAPVLFEKFKIHINE